MKKEKSYSIGLDIGTTSVGWAVIDNKNFKLLKYGNKRQSMWGVRLFNEAQTAEQRRNQRNTRRRYARRRERIKLLQNIFSDEILKNDVDFYNKLNTSFYSPEDKNNKKYNLTEFDKEEIFGNNKRKLSNKKYPTIYHLRQMLIDSEDKQDIRLIYLAIHHMIKYRGNFLYDNDSFNIENVDYKSQLNEFFELVNIYFPEVIIDLTQIDEEFYKRFEECLFINNKNDKKQILKEFLSNYFDTKFVLNFVNFLNDNEFSLFKMFNIETEDNIKLKFDDSKYEEKYQMIEDEIGEKIELLDKLFEIHNSLFLKKIVRKSNYSNISKIMIDTYDKHKTDLKYLKDLVRNDKKLFKEMFKGDCLYNKYINNKISYNDFMKKLDSYNELKEREDYINETFLPRITSTNNGLYPYQLNKAELIKIIENQGRFYPFLKETIEVNNKRIYKLVRLLEFKIPYYVGPLNKNTSNSEIKNPNAWAVRKIENVKITPFKFDEIIDKDLSAELFITRMIKNCTYLNNKKVIPNNSILYSKFKVLNELKQISINNQRLTLDMQHTIYEDLILKTKENVTEKMLNIFLKKYYPEIVSIKGFSADGKFANNMKSYVDFFGNDGFFANTNYNENDAEEIIKLVTIFEDKEILFKNIINKYPNLTKETINRIVCMKYKGWSNLSKEVLTDVLYYDKQSGIGKSIIDLMYETSLNFMQIINNKEYKFQKKFDDLNKVNSTELLDYSLVNSLNTSPQNKRAIYQAFKVVKSIQEILGYDPDNIMIEMARGESKIKSRKDSRKDNLLTLYESIKNDILKYINKDEYKILLNKIKNIPENELDSKLYLYFIQLGKSLYTQKNIDIEKLKSGEYEIDHIIPRSLIKDNSIDNLALVLREENQNKKASFVVPKEYRTKNMIEWWNFLQKNGLISSKKFNNLTRETYSKESIEGFINRQLVETRQVCKNVANILNSFYKNSNIIYLNAGISANYRENNEIYKFRNLNDLHHAKDAYLSAVLGLYKQKFLKSSTDFNELKELNKKFYELKDYKRLNYGYLVNSIELNKELIDTKTGEVLMSTEDFNKIIKKTMYQNDVIISRKKEFNDGTFYKDTKYKKEDLKNSKYPIKSNLPVSLYGGVTSCTYEYMMLIQYQVGNTDKIIFIGIPLAYSKSSHRDELIKKYIESNINTSNYLIIKDRIPFNTLVKYKGQLCRITGCSFNSSEVVNETQFILSKNEQLKFNDLFNLIFNGKNLPEDKSFVEIDKQANDLFDYILDKLKDKYPIYEGLCKKLLQIQKSGEFYKLDLQNNVNESIDKIRIIKELFKVVNCSSANANLSKLSKTIKFSDREGRISGVGIVNPIIIKQSFLGLKEKEYEFSNSSNNKPI